jgi:hypothetical protein
MDTIVPRLAGDRILGGLSRYPSVVLSHLGRRDTPGADLGCEPELREASHFEAVAADLPRQDGSGLEVALGADKPRDALDGPQTIQRHSAQVAARGEGFFGPADDRGVEEPGLLGDAVLRPRESL